MVCKQNTSEILNKVIFLKNSKKYNEAIELAQKAFRATKDNCLNNEIYNCFILQNKYNDAATILIKMLKYEPSNLSLMKKLSAIYFRTGDYKNALKYYKKIIDREPANADNQYNIGITYHYLNDRKKAYQHYYNALSINTKHSASLNNIGLLYYEAKDYENAIKIFKKAISISPCSPEAYHHMGIILRDYKDDKELSEYYIKKAIRLDPEYADNYYQLALTYNSCCKQQEMTAALEKCLELNPQNTQAKLLLEKIREKSNKK